MNKDKYTVTRSKLGLKVRDVWLNDTVYTDADIVYYLNSPTPMGTDHEPYHTLLVPLNLSEEELMRQCSKNTRSKIRFADRRDELQLHFGCEKHPEDLKQFQNDYTEFVEWKKIRNLEWSFVEALHAINAFSLTKITNHEGKVMSWHGYRVDVQRATLLYTMSTTFRESESEERNKIGRANRLLHFKDLLYFKELGVEHYDFGGWYAGEEDQELLRINQFKEGFGGTVQKDYLCRVYPTIKGKLFYRAKKLKQKLRSDG